MIEYLRKIRLAEIEKQINELEQNQPLRKEFSWLKRKLDKKSFNTAEEEYKRSNKEWRNKLEELKSLKYKYAEAQVPAQLDLGFEESLKLLQDNNITPVLTEKDLSNVAVVTKPDISTFDGLILVHKTGHVPIDGRIHSVKEANTTKTGVEKIGNIEIPIAFQSERNTVHFSVNTEVSSHFWGNWDDKKYAILIPFNDIPKDDIKSSRPEDTYILGGVTLTKNSWILVPKGEKETVQKNNPLVNIIEYEGPNVSGYANQLIKYLGYKKISVDTHGWVDYHSQHNYEKLMSQHGFKFDSHSYSFYGFQETFDTYMAILYQVLNYISEHKELLKDENIRYELRDKIKSPITFSREAILYSVPIADLIDKICDAFKDTEFEIKKDDFEGCEYAIDCEERLADIIMAKLLNEEQLRI